MSKQPLECFGNQGASVAEAFPYNCSKCADFKVCREKTFKAMAESERHLGIYEFNRRG